MSDDRPIGVFDSGIGGLTVVNSLMNIMPNESIYYVGDTARVPYGNKSKNRIKQYSEEIVKWLIDKNCKMIVIACNTASAIAIDHLKSTFKIPVIGVIQPGAKKAISITKNNSIGVLGTQATIESNAYADILKSLNPSLNIVSKACPLFVPLVEEGLVSGEIPAKIADQYLKKLTRTEIDTVILGCTHYPILKEIISKALGDYVKLVDSGKATSVSVKRKLQKLGLHSKKNSGELEVFVTDSKNAFNKIVKKSLGLNLHLEIKSISRIDIL